MDLLKVKDNVETLLQKSEKCREEDIRIIACIWTKQLGDKIKTISAEELMKLIANNELQSYKSIERAARKLREKNILYRGKNYKAKKAEQPKVNEQLKQF